MEYDTNELEQRIIEQSIIKSTDRGAYIFNSAGAINIYLTCNGEAKEGPKLTGQEVYHANKIVAKKFLGDWIKSKEIKPVIVPKKAIKRMNSKDFSSALKGF